MSGDKDSLSIDNTCLHVVSCDIICIVKPSYPCPKSSAFCYFSGSCFGTAVQIVVLSTVNAALTLCTYGDCSNLNCCDSSPIQLLWAQLIRATGICHLRLSLLYLYTTICKNIFPLWDLVACGSWCHI